MNAALNPPDQQRRCPAEDEHPPPSEVRANEVIGKCGKEEPEVVPGVHVPSAHLATILRPLLRDEGAADRLFAAEPDPAKHPQHRELPYVLDDAAREGEKRIHQDRHHQRLHSSEAIRDWSPHHRHAPSGEEQREQDAAVEPDVARRRRDARFRQKLGQRGHEHQRVDEGIHPIETPSAPGRPEAFNLVGIQFGAGRQARRSGCGRRRGSSSHPGPLL